MGDELRSRMLGTPATSALRAPREGACAGGCPPHPPLIQARAGLALCHGSEAKSFNPTKRLGRERYP